MRRQALVLSTVLILAGVAGGIDQGRAGDDRSEEKDRGKPKLRLVAEPAVGFLPVTTILTAQLSGVAPKDPAFCHPAVTWKRINPWTREENASLYHEDAACRHPPEEAVAITSFSRTFTLEDPGSYLFKVIIQTNDGRRVESAYARVEVLRVQ